MAKANGRQQFGVTGSATQNVVRVFGKRTNFDHDDIVLLAYWGVTSDAKVVQMNTYNGETGKKYNPANSTKDYEGDAPFLKRMKKGGYVEVPVGGMAKDLEGNEIPWPIQFAAPEAPKPEDEAPEGQSEETGGTEGTEQPEGVEQEGTEETAPQGEQQEA
jgi:hypothetical protein